MFGSYLSNDFHCYYKSEQFTSVQNEVELLQIGAYLSQIGTAITDRCTKQVYSGRVIFIKIEDHNYEF